MMMYCLAGALSLFAVFSSAVRLSYGIEEKKSKDYSDLFLNLLDIIMWAKLFHFYDNIVFFSPCMAEGLSIQAFMGAATLLKQEWKIMLTNSLYNTS